jgi:hypothetical protein
LRPTRVEINRRAGDGVDSLEAESVDDENLWRAMYAHILGHSSIGRGASNIDGGISALNSTTAALDLNSGHA